MANVQYVTYMDFATNLYNVMNDIIPIFPIVQAALASEMLLNPAWAAIDLSVEEKNATLKLLTGLTAALEPDVNCYPRGYDLTLCFDIDGNELP